MSSDQRAQTLKRLGAARRAVVRPGDTLSQICRDSGMRWTEVYDHPLNAELREQRSDPHFIMPGDIVWLPLSLSTKS